MEIPLSYGTKIRSDVSAMNTVFFQTVRCYTEAVRFLCVVCENEYERISALNSKETVNIIEPLIHATAEHPKPKYDSFDVQFQSFPSYLRRGAIAAAAGKVKGWHSMMENWKNGGMKGKAPTFPRVNHDSVPLYFANMFFFTDENGKRLPDRSVSCNAMVKVFCSQRQLLQDKRLDRQVRKKINAGKLDPSKMVWDWLPVRLKTSDVGYLKKLLDNGAQILCPSLSGRGKQYILQFPTKRNTKLNDTPLAERKVLAVDLGINTPATCCVMRADGTVVARRFFSPAKDMGCLRHKTAMVSRAQSKGSRKTPVLWRMADNANRKLSDETATFIMTVAEEFNADVIVFEHLDTSGKKKGSKKARLHHWRAKYVQELVTNRAHVKRIRISHICAWGTSRLAYDGSGKVTRGIKGNYSICRFTTGKIYNCDLSASYNIGARYFIREIEKTTPAKVWSELKAKVPGLTSRTTCTLSTLIRLCAELQSSDCSKASGTRSDVA